MVSERGGYPTLGGSDIAVPKTEFSLQANPGNTCSVTYYFYISKCDSVAQPGTGGLEKGLLDSEASGQERAGMTCRPTCGEFRVGEQIMYDLRLPVDLSDQPVDVDYINADLYRHVAPPRRAILIA